MGWFCKHKWIEKERHYGKSYRCFDDKDCGDILIIVQECKKCGKLNKVRIP